MSGMSLYSEMIQRGFQFHVNGNQLKCRGTQEWLSPELTQKLRRHKAEILACLDSGPPSIRSIQLDEAAKLFRDRGWVQIWSGYLNCSVYLVQNEKSKVPDPVIPRYTQAQVEALKDLRLDEMQTLHEAKMIFKGTVHRGDINRREDV
jgi:hypothetical protein